MTIRNHEAKYIPEEKYRILAMKDKEGAARARGKKTEVLIRNCSACVEREAKGGGGEGNERES